MSNSITQTSRHGKFTGWHMLGIMVLFFGVIISVNMFMAFSAIGTWTGLVVENSYVASQEFNTKRANAKAQHEMGWQTGLSYDQRTLTFTLRDANGAPLRAQEVTIALSRPIGTIGDQSHLLAPTSSGDYAIAVDLEPGAWNAIVVAQFADQPPLEQQLRLNVEAK